MFDDLADAADVGGAGDGVGVNDAKAEVGVEERVHHNAVTELENLEREDSAGEENQGQREYRELYDVVWFRRICLVMIGEGRGRSSKRAEPVKPARLRERRWLQKGLQHGVWIGCVRVYGRLVSE